MFSFTMVKYWFHYLHKVTLKSLYNLVDTHKLVSVEITTKKLNILKEKKKKIAYQQWPGGYSSLDRLAAPVSSAAAFC